MKKKEMVSLTNKEKKIHCEQKLCYICKKGFSTHYDNKKYHKVRDHDYIITKDDQLIFRCFECKKNIYERF